MLISLSMQCLVFFQAGKIESLVKFLEFLTTSMHAAKEESEIIWYDSVTNEGSLVWQNELNSKNRYACNLFVIKLPDIIACWEGKFFAIETKAPGKIHNTTPNQDIQIEAIRAAKGWALVVDNATQVEDFINERLQERVP